MNGYIVNIGMVDKADAVHSVEFKQGVNVITGKSSTGKSAMIEIFDYCMGSSENNIPHGEITKHGKWFFTVLKLEATFLILGRNYENDGRFIKTETSQPNVNEFNADFFDDTSYSIKNKLDFNVELGRHFGLTIEDIEEDTEDRQYRKNQAKKGRPTIRNIMPFMLQHQNLVANKHALFYRFDQKEKRDTTIEQFKIFMNFVNPEYFLLLQKEKDLDRQVRRLEKQIIDSKAKKEEYTQEIADILNIYNAITDRYIFNDKANPKEIYKNPNKYLSQLQTTPDIQRKTSSDGDEAITQLTEYEAEKNIIELELRQTKRELATVKSSIEIAKNSYTPLSEGNNSFETTVHNSSECKFCHNTNDDNFEIANELNDAINWLNKELAHSTYQIDTFESKKAQLEVKLSEIEPQYKLIKEKIHEIKQIEENLKNHVTSDNQANRQIGKLELALERISHIEILSDDELEKIKTELEEIRGRLKSEFNVESKLTQATRYINKQMNLIGQNFDFEKAYDPIKLKFSLDTFDLYHLTPDEQKVYLRSMGSGANWLYSHLSLFLALQRYFCDRGKESMIPPILFLDQPTQVYFPTNIKDNSTAFNAEEIAEKLDTVENLDEDIKSVTNIFYQLVLFCEETEKNTGIKPQVIVTDHADNLDFSILSTKTESDLFGAKVTFENLVIERWRDRGFIHPLNGED